MKPELFADVPATRTSRFRRYAPLLLWMGFIFFASTAEFSGSNTSKVLEPLLLWFFPRINEETIGIIHLIVRKAAHFTEYAIFAVLAARAFLGSSHDVLRRHWLLVALALITFYSLSDEFHQSFVPTRTASIYDSMIDTAGGFVTLVSLALWRVWHNKQTRSASL